MKIDKDVLKKDIDELNKEINKIKIIKDNKYRQELEDMMNKIDVKYNMDNIHCLINKKKMMIAQSNNKELELIGLYENLIQNIDEQYLK